MARIMEKVTPVKIVTDEVNCFATIQRSCLAGITALLRLQKGGDLTKGKHINAQLTKMRELKRWAESQYESCVDAVIDEAGNPALG